MPSQTRKNRPFSSVKQRSSLFSRKLPTMLTEPQRARAMVFAGRCSCCSRCASGLDAVSFHLLNSTKLYGSSGEINRGLSTIQSGSSARFVSLIARFASRLVRRAERGDQVLHSQHLG